MLLESLGKDAKCDKSPRKCDRSSKCDNFERNCDTKRDKKDVSGLRKESDFRKTAGLLGAVPEAEATWQLAL